MGMPGARRENCGVAMDLKQHIGLKVREARLRRSLTQQQLAEEVDKAVETISNIERGHSYTGLETLEKLGQALEIPIREFFEEYEEARSLSKRRFAVEAELRGRVRPLRKGS